MALSHWIERHERAVAGASIVFFLALGVWMIANARGDRGLVARWRALRLQSLPRGDGMTLNRTERRMWMFGGLVVAFLALLAGWGELQAQAELRYLQDGLAGSGGALPSPWP